MDYANAYEVMANNEIAQGICLVNMAVINFNNSEFHQAAERFKLSADKAKALIRKA